MGLSVDIFCEAQSRVSNRILPSSVQALILYFCEAQFGLWYSIYLDWFSQAQSWRSSGIKGWGLGFLTFPLFYLWGFKVSTPCKCGILGFPIFIGSTVITLKVWDLIGYSFHDCGKCDHNYWWSDFLFHQRIWMLCPFGIQPIKSRDRLLALHLLLALH